MLKSLEKWLPKPEEEGQVNLFEPGVLLAQLRTPPVRKQVTPKPQVTRKRNLGGASCCRKCADDRHLVWMDELIWCPTCLTFTQRWS